MSSKKKRGRDEPTWVHDEYHGWLPDEAPLFEFCWEPGYSEIRCPDSSTWAYGESKFLGVFDNECDETRRVHCGHLGEDCYHPLTTAARELLDALKAEGRQVTRRKEPRSLPPEIQRQVDANAATRELRRRVIYDIRSSFASYGMSKAELATLLENEAGVLRAEVEQDKRDARGRR